MGQDVEPRHSSYPAVFGGGRVSGDPGGHGDGIGEAWWNVSENRLDQRILRSRARNIPSLPSRWGQNWRRAPTGAGPAGPAGPVAADAPAAAVGPPAPAASSSSPSPL